MEKSIPISKKWMCSLEGETYAKGPIMAENQNDAKRQFGSIYSKTIKDVWETDGVFKDANGKRIKIEVRY